MIWTILTFCYWNRYHPKDVLQTLFHLCPLQKTQKDNSKWRYKKKEEKLKRGVYKRLLYNPLILTFYISTFLYINTFSYFQIFPSISLLSNFSYINIIFCQFSYIDKPFIKLKRKRCKGRLQDGKSNNNKYMLWGTS